MERHREFASVLDKVAKEIGIENLNPKQREAIKTFIAGRNLIVTLPTGYGKSIVYAIMPTVCDKIRGKYSNKNVYNV